MQLTRWVMVVMGAPVLLAACARGSDDAGSPRDSASAGKDAGAAAESPGPAEAFTVPVFTAAQATRGERVYRSVCARCHTMPQYTGSAFAAAWNNRRVSDLYDIVSNAMPQDDPGSLTEQQYLDVIAYLLSLNGFHAGKVPLRADTAMLRHARIVLPPPAGDPGRGPTRMNADTSSRS